MRSLIHTLELSLAKNGDKVLTISHLINILKLSERTKDISETKRQQYIEDITAECLDPNQ